MSWGLPSDAAFRVKPVPESTTGKSDVVLTTWSSTDDCNEAMDVGDCKSVSISLDINISLPAPFSAFESTADEHVVETTPSWAGWSKAITGLASVMVLSKSTVHPLDVRKRAGNSSDRVTGEVPMPSQSCFTLTIWPFSVIVPISRMRVTWPSDVNATGTAVRGTVSPPSVIRLSDMLVVVTDVRGRLWTCGDKDVSDWVMVLATMASLSVILWHDGVRIWLWASPDTLEEEDNKKSEIKNTKDFILVWIHCSPFLAYLLQFYLLPLC